MNTKYTNLATPSASSPREPEDTQRLTSREVEERVLSEAIKVVEDKGLSVNLDYLVMDEIVEAAGVARSTARRIWPKNQEFYVDLLIRLIDPDGSRGAAFDPKTLEVASEVINRYRDLLLTPTGRVAVLREAVRLGAKQNFEAIKDSIYWKSYTALSLALPLLQDEDRERVVDALRRVEGRFISQMAAFYELMLAHFVRRPKPGISLEQIAAAGSATVEGLALRWILNTDLVDKSIQLPGVDGTDVDWHLAAVGFLGVIQTMTEPVSGDPIEYALIPVSSTSDGY